MEESLAYYASVLRADFTEFCTKKLQEVGITVGLLYFVLYIGKNPDCRHSELIEALHADAGHATRSLDRLISDGFVTREKSSTDKRVARLNLTDQGRTAFQQAHNLFTQWDAEVLATIEPQEKTALLQTLAILTESRSRGTRV